VPAPCSGWVLRKDAGGRWQRLWYNVRSPAPALVMDFFATNHCGQGLEWTSEVDFSDAATFTRPSGGSLGSTHVPSESLYDTMFSVFGEVAVNADCSERQVYPSRR
jgi:hypothetical protein